MSKVKHFFITTPIYYVNDRPHIGSAYSTLLADVIARQKRKEGYIVHFSTGTDEHGQKIFQSAKNAGEKVEDFVDRIAGLFKKSWEDFDISFDDFIRTSERRHKKTVTHFLEKLKQSGSLYQGTYKGLYCVGCETFLDESELLNGLCPDHLKKPELLEEKNWFFRLSDYKERLKKLIDDGEMEIQPEGKKNETLGLLKIWASDVSISREHVSWGIPLPWDKNQISYVWIDALINYLTTIGYPEKQYEDFWPCDIHIIGKNILKHHAVIWPALLLAVGVQPPKKIFAHSFITIEGQKMSKSLGNVITPKDLIQKFSVDGARYALLAEISPNNDSDISREKLQARYDADLKNNIGNIFSRLIVLAQKNGLYDLRLTTNDLKIEKYKKTFFEEMENINISGAIKNTQKIFEEINQYLDKTKPWKETDEEKIKEVLEKSFTMLFEGIDLLEPVLPQTAKNVLTIKKGDAIIIPKENIHLFA